MSTDAKQRRRQPVASAKRRADDLRAFTYAIGGALALSPIMWQHYLVLLAVPLAISRPRFSMFWLLPIILWVSPRAGNGDGLETLLPAVVVATLLAAIVAASERGTERRSRAIGVPAT